MEFTVDLFACDTCSEDCEGHPEDHLVDLLITPPPPEPQTGTPFAVCGNCLERMREYPSQCTLTVMDLH